MKPLRQIIFLGCVVASFIAGAGEPLSPETKGAADKTGAVERQLLQGKWVGTMVGDQAHQKITVMIVDSSLHFLRDTNFWFETTFTLPPGTGPAQLHATIKDCPPPQADSIGKMVVAIYRIEGGKLTLAALGDGDEETPKSFEAAAEKGMARYELWKVPPVEENTKPPDTK